MLLEKILERFKLEEFYIWEAKKFLSVSCRIPKESSTIFLAQVIKEGQIIKVNEAKYRLRKDINNLLEKEKKELKIIRNRIFL